METIVHNQITVSFKITIIDYGMGNLWSVKNALSYVGAIADASNDPIKIASADALVLPGVGSFRKAMESLRKSGIDQAITETVLERKRPILGICLGMQLLAEYGTEDGETLGMGLMAGKVKRFDKGKLKTLKVPHIGFNTVNSFPQSRLFAGLPPENDFYFVHSYRLLPTQHNGTLAFCDYGGKFLAAYENKNVFATQFHPEKSQTNGLRLLENFLMACKC